MRTLSARPKSRKEWEDARGTKALRRHQEREVFSAHFAAKHAGVFGAPAAKDILPEELHGSDHALPRGLVVVEQVAAKQQDVRLRQRKSFSARGGKCPRGSRTRLSRQLKCAFGVQFVSSPRVAALCRPGRRLRTARACKRLANSRARARGAASRRDGAGRERGRSGREAPGHGQEGSREDLGGRRVLEHLLDGKEAVVLARGIVVLLRKAEVVVSRDEDAEGVGVGRPGRCPRSGHAARRCGAEEEVLRSLARRLNLAKLPMCPKSGSRRKKQTRHVEPCAVQQFAKCSGRQLGPGGEGVRRPA